MKSFLFLLAAVSSFSVSMAQNKVINDANAVKRQAKDFHAIRVSSGIHLYLSQGNEEAVAVSASDAEYRDRIKTEVSNGVLKIYFDKEGWNSWHDWSKRKLRAYVSCKVLDELKASAGAQVEVDGTIKSTELFFDFSSGSNFTGAIQVDRLKMDQSSGGQATVSGSATQCTVDISSGGEVKAYDLITDVCSADISSGGSLKITVNKELSASASSGGQVHYKGSGMIKDISTSSGGEVSKR